MESNFQVHFDVKSSPYVYFKIFCASGFSFPSQKEIYSLLSLATISYCVNETINRSRR